MNKYWALARIFFDDFDQALTQSAHFKKGIIIYIENLRSHGLQTVE